jgi:hypothetical protein
LNRTQPSRRCERTSRLRPPESVHTVESWARAVLADILQALVAQGEGTTSVEVPTKVRVFKLEGASGYGVNLDVQQPTSTNPGQVGLKP